METTVYYIYRIYPQEEGEFERRLLGKLVMTPEYVRVVEDHDGLLADIFPTGPATPDISRRLAQMKMSPYWRVESHQDLQEGLSLDSIPELDLPIDTWEDGSDE